MKALSAYLPVPLLLTALILLSASSCSDRSGRVSSVLSAADSLMMTDPRAALDTLLTIDSIVVKKLNCSDKALYTLLRTETEYKCWLPVAEDTAVFRVPDYYRKKNKDYYGRALMMCGAVRQERSEAEQALQVYKEAETVIEASGDLEQLGLLHGRIGSLYQSSGVDDQSAIYRYRKAVECFEKAGLPLRVMSARLSLARLLMIDSSEKALPLLESAMSMAEEYGDRMCGLSAMELMTYNYDPETEGRAVVSIVSEAFSKYGEVPENSTEERIYKNLTIELGYAYIGLEKVDSARQVLSMMPLTDRVDSLSYYNLKAKISTHDKDWKTVAESSDEVWEIRSRIVKDGYETQLAESELRYDNAELRARLYKKEIGILLSVLILLVVLISVSLVARLMVRMFKRHKIETKRLEHTLQSRTIELERLKSEKDQEEASRRSLEASLRQQISSNKALMGYYNLNNNAMKRLIKIFNIYKGEPKYFLAKAVSVAEDLIAQTGGYDNVYALIDTAYPGFLNKLFIEFPGLKDEEKYLVALTCLGYPNGTVAYLLNISETNLATRRTRLAQKMTLGKSLVKYLNERLASYQACADSVS